MRSRLLRVMGAALVIVASSSVLTAYADTAQDEKESDASDLRGARRALEKEVPKLAFTGKAFHEALQELAEACDTTIHLDRSTLEAAGAKLDSPVTLAAAEGQTGESVLVGILKQTHLDGDKKMDYGVWCNVVVISTDEQIAISRRFMDRPLPEVTLTGVKLADALSFVRDVSGQRILVDWDRLKAAGVTRKTGVSLVSKPLSVADGLRTILDSAKAKEPVEFVLDQGRIVITRRDAIMESVKDPKALKPPDAPEDADEGGDGL